MCLQYIVFRVANNEVFVAVRRAALNMAYQDITVKNGEIDVVATVTGQVYIYTCVIIIVVCVHVSGHNGGSAESPVDFL